MFKLFNFHDTYTCIIKKYAFCSDTSYHNGSVKNAVPKICTSKIVGDLSRSIKCAHIFAVVQAWRISFILPLYSHCHDIIVSDHLSVYHCRMISQARPPTGSNNLIYVSIEVYANNKSVTKPSSYVAVYPINHSMLALSLFQTWCKSHSTVPRIMFTSLRLFIVVGRRLATSPRRRCQAPRRERIARRARTSWVPWKRTHPRKRSRTSTRWRRGACPDWNWSVRNRVSSNSSRNRWQ